MNKKQIQDILSKMFVLSDDKKRECFRTEYMKEDNEAYPIQQIISDAQYSSGLSFEFSYEIASRAVDILSNEDDWQDISEAIDSCVPVYTNALMEIYASNSDVVNEATEAIHGKISDSDSTQRAQYGWYQAINNMTQDIAGKLEEIINEDESDEDKEKKREEAIGYNKPLRDLLTSDNPAIVRLAKGIKKEFTK